MRTLLFECGPVRRLKVHYFNRDKGLLRTLDTTSADQATTLPYIYSDCVVELASARGFLHRIAIPRVYVKVGKATVSTSLSASL
jgi:hypothetical protein